MALEGSSSSGFKTPREVGEKEAKRVPLGQASKYRFILSIWLLFYVVILLEMLGRGLLDFSGVLTCS